MASGEFDPSPLLDLLTRHEVDFVLIGGLAAIARGSARATFDIDVAYSRDEENLERLTAALREADAKLRGAPTDVPFLDAKTLERGPNFTFATRFGSLDTLGEPAGAPAYRELRAAATAVQVRGFTILVASLDHVIAMKEVSARPHDLATAAELRVISDELRAP